MKTRRRGTLQELHRGRHYLDNAHLFVVLFQNTSCQSDSLYHFNIHAVGILAFLVSSSCEIM